MHIGLSSLQTKFSMSYLYNFVYSCSLSYVLITRIVTALSVIFALTYEFREMRNQKCPLMSNQIQRSGKALAPSTCL